MLGSVWVSVECPGTTGLKNAEGTVLLLPQRAQLVVRRERTWRTRRTDPTVLRLRCAVDPGRVSSVGAQGRKIIFDNVALIWDKMILITERK